MVPALLLTFVALLYRLFFSLAGAPVDWANFSPLSLSLFPKIFAARAQALPLGHPGFPPTHLLLRNTLLSDLLFTALLPISQALLRPQRASSDLPGLTTFSTL